MLIGNKFVSDYVAAQGLMIIEQDESRPWGGYYIYKVGDNFDQKILWVKPGEFLSLQYHGDDIRPGHSEEWIALTHAKVVLGNRSAVDLTAEEMQAELQALQIITLEPGQKLLIPSGFLHALVNPFEQDIFIQETRMSAKAESSAEREANIVRIYDIKQRDNSLPWPLELTQRIKA